MKHTAFTLIELLVVIAIIGLLSTMLIAGIGGSQKLAEDKAAMSFLTLIDEGLNQYRTEYSFYPPHTLTGDTNNLAYCLNHPKPKIPKTRADRDFAKSTIGYPNDYLWGKIGPEHYDYSSIDWDTLTGAMVQTTPIPIFDTYPAEGSDYGSPLIYVHPLANRTIYAGTDFDYDVRTHCQKGFNSAFDLWSRGIDGEFSSDYHLHDLDLLPNQDNVTATPYK